MGRKPTLLRGWSRAVRVRPKGQGCPPLGVWGQPRESGAPSDLRHALPRPQGPPTHAQASPRPTYSTAALLGLADGMDGGPWTDSSRWPEAAGWANQLSDWSGRGGGPGTAGASPPLASRTRRWQRGDRPHVSRAAVRLATVSLGALVPVPEPRKQGAQGWRQHGKWPLCLLPWRRPGAPGRAPWRARPPRGTRALPGPGEAPAEKPRFPGPESGVTVSQRGGELDVSG